VYDIAVNGEKLNVRDMQHTTQRWQGIGRSVGPACIGQAGRRHPIQCTYISLVLAERLSKMGSVAKGV
jgi:hypothetical protein